MYFYKRKRNYFGLIERKGSTCSRVGVFRSFVLVILFGFYFVGGGGIYILDKGDSRWVRLFSE